MLKYEVYINGNELKGRFENLKDATRVAKRLARSRKKLRRNPKRRKSFNVLELK